MAPRIPGAERLEGRNPEQLCTLGPGFERLGSKWMRKSSQAVVCTEDMEDMVLVLDDHLIHYT